jgi:hypothetical protein
LLTREKNKGEEKKRGVCARDERKIKGEKKKERGEATKKISAKRSCFQ